MQLDLFEDNRPGILLNIADEFIAARDLEQAASVYQQLLDDCPDDKHSAGLLALIAEWQAALCCLDLSDPEIFQSTWLRFEAIFHPPLRATVLSILLDEMLAVPNPEMIYAPPRFHFGHILLEAGHYVEAVECFDAALSFNNIPRGRLLAWRGDALTLGGNHAEALKSYRDAFLNDPFTIDMQSIKNRKIAELHTSLYFESMDDIDEDQASAWLPVWGWLQGVFALPQHVSPETGAFDASGFESLLSDGKHSLPRLWFDMLTHAERLRTMVRDDRELAEVRRLMKASSAFMFGCYLEKIRGTR